MDKFIINGGNKLNGSVDIGGAKNAVLPIMAATIISAGKYKIYNVPKLKDTLTMKKLLEIVGAKISYLNNTMDIDTTHCNTPIAPYELVKTMRASFYVLGPFLSRFKEAHVSLPGGCAWGPRPVNYHLQAIEAMGGEIDLSDGMIVAKGSLKGAEIKFKISSVGATGNTLMAAVLADGITIIRNAAKEPEIVSLCIFLQKMGAEIDGIGTSDLKITGKKSLNSDIEYKVIPDRIEAGTFLLAAASTFGEVTINNIEPKHLKLLLLMLEKSGFYLHIGNNAITIQSKNDSIIPINMNTEIYPGFPTDLQAQWMSLMAISRGRSTIVENVYKDRFTHIAELNRFGAKIELDQNTAYITGVKELNGAPVMSTDIRASASLIIAALSANGESEISRIYHIDRGYENIEYKLKKLGADIKRIK
jgi:UDP-N-acetylglucosamine 1-carboxyvinyltransferase